MSFELPKLPDFTEFSPDKLFDIASRHVNQGMKMIQGQAKEITDTLGLPDLPEIPILSGSPVDSLGTLPGPLEDIKQTIEEKLPTSTKSKSVRIKQIMGEGGVPEIVV